MTDSSSGHLLSLLEKMYKNSAEPIIIFNGEGALIEMNPAAEKIISLQTQGQIESSYEKSFCQTCRGYTSEDEFMSCMNCYLSNPKVDITSFQVHIETQDGIIPYSASLQTIDAESGTRVLMLRDLTNQFETQEIFYRSTMTRSIIQAQENERKRISRELHDSVAQELLSSLVDLRVIKYLNVQQDVLQKIQQIEEVLTRLLEQIRNLSVELRPASLDDLGLEAAFRSHFKWIEKNYGILVYFVSELNGARFNSEIETVIYRICQESILNALKYAGVDEIKVRLFQSDTDLELIVKDQGTGFQVNMRDPKGTGLGLYGMRERAELVGGELAIISEPGAGTMIHLQIPLGHLSDAVLQ